MSFEEAPSVLRCNDCQEEIDLDRYRRKVARCDQCEADALKASVHDSTFTHRLNVWREPTP